MQGLHLCAPALELAMLPPSSTLSTLCYTLPSAAKGLCSACKSALFVATRAAEAYQVGARMHLHLLRSAAVRYVVASIMLAGMPSSLSSASLVSHAGEQGVRHECCCWSLPGQRLRSGTLL